MKQKYTLSIADMQINVVTEEPRESVDRLVGILDRKMREITLKSKKCPKNEAALLCALEFCADKISMKEELEDLEDRVEAAGKEISAAEKKIAKLETENAKLRAELAEMKAKKETTVEKAPVVAATPVVETAPVVEEAPVAEPATEEAPAEKPAVSKKKQSRNKVGSMFDLLTFSDI